MYIVIAFLVFYVFQPLKIKESGGTHERIVNREIHSDVLEIPPGLLLLEDAWRAVRNGWNPRHQRLHWR